MSTEPNPPELGEASYRLSVRLPGDWRTVDVEQLGRILERAEEVSGEVAEADAADALTARIQWLADALGTGPDLVAVLDVPFAAERDRPAGRLTASLVAYVLDCEDLPRSVEDALGRQIVDGVELYPGWVQSFVVYSHAVRSPDGQKLALLSFSSPDVEVADELAAGFAELAAGARLEAAA